MSPALPASAGPMLLAVLACIAVLIPAAHPAACDPDWAACEDGQDGPADLDILLAGCTAL